MGENRDLIYRVDGMSCAHCQLDVSAEVGKVDGVEAVDVDLETKLVRVHGQQLDDALIRSAIDEAGYEPEPA
jgi:copper chaperone CopZ